MKNKKTIAFAMAAMSVAGTVVPSFAAVQNDNEAIVDMGIDNLDEAQKIEEDIKLPLIEGKKTVVKTYNDIYNNNFTPDDKTDDTLRDEFEILDTIKEEEKEYYVVTEKLKEEEIDKTEQQKHKELLKSAKKEISRKKYEIIAKVYSKGILNEDKDGLSDAIKLNVYLKDKKTGVITYYTFLNPTMGESEYNEAKNYEFVFGKENSSLTDNNLEDNAKLFKKSYLEFSKLIYNLENISDKYTTTSNQEDNDTLELKICKKDENKKHVATIKITGMNNFRLENLKRIPGKNDYNGHWAEENIFQAMYDGRVDVTNNFRFNDGITRAEFVKIVNNTFGFTTKANAEYFLDVNEDDWFYENILIAVQEGYIKGYEDSTFKPYEKITREEASVIIATILNNGESKESVINNGNAVIEKDVKTSFVDDKDIAVWADESVNYLSGNEESKDSQKTDIAPPIISKEDAIIKGYEEDNTFRPKNNITRAEALVIMERAQVVRNNNK